MAVNFLSISQSQKKWVDLINLLFVFGLSFVIAILFKDNIFIDPDVAWHIKAGEIIVKNNVIPTHDMLTFTSDQQWYNLSWVWDVLVYHIYQFSGDAGLYFLQSLLFALTIALGYLMCLSFKGFNPDTKAIVTTLSALLLWDSLYARPQMFTYMLCGLALFIIFKREIKLLFILPIIAMVWANMHGSFIAIYTIIFAFIVQSIYERDYVWLRALIVVLIFCFLSILVNPLGYKIFIAVFRTLNSCITGYIAEWLPFSFGHQYGPSMVIIILMMVGAFADSRIPVAYRLLAFAWLLASLASRRNFGYFAVLAIPYLGYALEPIIAARPSKFIFSNRLKIIALFTIFVIGGIAAPYLQRTNESNAAKMPLEAIKYLNQNCKGARVFNEYNIGGYLALWMTSDNKYFIDGRAGTVFSELFLDEYLKVFMGEGDLKELLDKYKVDAAIIRGDALKMISYNKAFSQWKKIYKDDKFVIYTRKGSKTCKITS
ncbi:MAG: hypothetical protein K0R73_164 [Candidatus Midichloriaceae bacterium]|jgi:hypothetical protein|nr:hypothetical protein [Candidatus Midichloriaceae bacterium]